VEENQRQEVSLRGDELNGDGTSQAVDADVDSQELVCRVPDETLFQLQQIYEAVEARIASDPTASSADGKNNLRSAKKKKSRRESALATDDGPSPQARPKPTDAGGADVFNVPAAVSKPSLSAIAPMKTPSKKRARRPDDPATEVVQRHKSRAMDEHAGETERKLSKKKERRRSTST
ncbi:unnamed protein product, partial [Sphacelaria rigidula]